MNFSELSLRLSTMWEHGGFLMVWLTLLALIIYFECVTILSQLILHPFISKRKADGSLTTRQSKLLNSLFESKIFKNCGPSYVLHHYNAETKQYFSRRLLMLKRFMKAAPLLGLLGTVTGLLSTFAGMLSVGLAKMDGMAKGISQALITTQYGLLIVIPGLLLMVFMQASYKRLLLHLTLTEMDYESKSKDLKKDVKLGEQPEKTKIEQIAASADMRTGSL